MTLKEFRESLQLTQKQLADELGVHWTTVQAWESGKRGPNEESLKKLSELGNVVAERKPAEQPYIPPKRPKIRIDDRFLRRRTNDQ